MLVKQALLDPVGETHGVKFALQLAVAFAVELGHHIPLYQTVHQSIEWTA